MWVEGGKPARRAGVRERLRAAALVAAVGCSTSVIAVGATKTWAGATGSWSVGTNWGPTTGQPVSGDIVRLIQSDSTTRLVTYDALASTGTVALLDIDATGSGTMTLALPGASTQTIVVQGPETIGINGKGFWQQSGGTHSVIGATGTDGIVLGSGVTGSGTYSLSGGTFIVTAPAGIMIGGAGMGVVSQTGGVSTIGSAAAYRTLFIGTSVGSAGTYLLGGSGVLNVFGTEQIGSSGAGSFIQTGGNHTLGSVAAPGVLAVGYFSTGIGNYGLSGTGSLTVHGELRVGSSGAGTFTQTSGTQSIGTESAPGSLYVGYAPGSSGQYLMSGLGVLTVLGDQYIGADGAGTFNQTGGINTVGSPTSPGGLYVGFSSGSGRYMLGGTGSLIVNGPEYIGYTTSGTFSQSGGTHTIGSGSANGSLLLGVSVGGAGTYLLSGGVLDVRGSVVVGSIAQGTFNQSGGGHSIGTASGGGELSIGSGTGSTGRYVLGAGSLTVNGDEYVGRFAAGTVDQSGGSHVVGSVAAPGNLHIGFAAGATGTYLLSGTGSLLVQGHEFVGESGSGVFTQSGGSHSIGSAAAVRDLYIGHGAGSSGRYALSGNATASINGNEYIGYSGAATFSQSGGTHLVGSASVPGDLHIGLNPGSSGSYSLSAGVLVVHGEESIGQGGAGAFTHTGGSHTVGMTSLPAALRIGDGSYQLSGSGSLTVIGDEIVGSSGAGLFNQTGTAHSIGLGSVSGNLTVGAAPGSAGTFLLNGGSLVVSGDVTIGASGAGTFLQTGGAQTIGTIASPRRLFLGRFPGSTGRLQLGGSGSLNINGDAFIGGNTSTANGSGLLDIGTGSATISGTLKIWNSPATAVNLNGGTLLAGAVVNDAAFTQTSGNAIVGNFDNSSDGAGSLTVAAGTLRAGRIRQGPLMLPGTGQIILSSSGAADATSRITSLDIASTASSFDLADNDLIIDYDATSPVGEVRQMLMDQRLRSSAATSTTGLGFAEASDLFGTFPATFNGLSIDSPSLLVKYTFLGDANLDGRVDKADLGAIARNWVQATDSWSDGDFNYDGQVNLRDLYLLSLNWLQGTGDSAPLAVSLTSVPEPGMGAVLLGAAVMLMRRRVVTATGKVRSVERG